MKDIIVVDPATGDFFPDDKAMVLGKALEFLAKRTIPVRYCDLVVLLAHDLKVPEDPLGAIVMYAADVLIRAGLVVTNDRDGDDLYFGSRTLLQAAPAVVNFAFDGYLAEAAE